MMTSGKHGCIIILKDLEIFRQNLVLVARFVQYQIAVSAICVRSASLAEQALDKNEKECYEMILLCGNVVKRACTSHIRVCVTKRGKNEK